jgi:aminoglycoside/choline kinase family phosphotransferase
MHRAHSVGGDKIAHIDCLGNAPSLNRDAQLTSWVSAQLPEWNGSLEPASADASFRRYFRIRVGPASRIVMDAPPPQEDCRPFVMVRDLLHRAGVHVPRVYSSDLDQGFLLLSDLGTRTFLDVLDSHNADRLFGDATEALLSWQLSSRDDVLPVYDETLLRRELDLFPQWYLSRHLECAPSPGQQDVLQSAFRKILDCNLAQPSVFVHRDFMPRNLMLSEPNPGVLDFQDAVYGPISYDLACLFKDAFISWPEEAIIDWTIRYWDKARRAGLPVNSDFGEFYRDTEWMALQRHLKVLGIFARISYRDGKPKYLTDAPRFVSYVRATCRRYAALFPLLRLFDELNIVETESTAP